MEGTIGEAMAFTLTRTEDSPRFNPVTMRIGEDGEAYCQLCGYPKSVTKDYSSRTAPFLKSMGVMREWLVCKCEREREEKEDAELRRSRVQRREDELRTAAMLPPRYAGSRFSAFSLEDVSQSVADARRKAEEYCKDSLRMLSRNEGAWLSGKPGLGKTELMACMANELMRGGRHTVLFTSCLDFALSARFGRETDMLDMISSVDFLFLDDVGAERYRKMSGEDTWIQEKVYEIVNARYNAMRPIVCSSNYTLADLQRDRGLAHPVVDRLAEMTAAHRITLDGRSWRLRRA